MSVIRIASRYAKSLLDLAIEQNKLERIHEDMEGFEKALESRDFYLLLKSPVINPDKKKKIIDEIFSGKFDELTQAFIRIIITKGREAYLPEIAEEFMNQYKIHNHITSVKLTTATPMSAETVERIKKRLVESHQTDDKIEIETVVDPSLIGGFVLEFDDKLYDTSVAHQLEMLKKEFMKNEFVATF